MSMLAEPRRKVRYNINPNGNTWANDSNAFGKKMLEKMGWSSGKGLGANLDGMTTHVKVNYKCDQQGVGFKDKNDQWTVHEDNFTALLKNLQSDGHQAIANENEASDEKAGTGRKSLELKSKVSRSRVHYKKFTRGKDLSRYSSKDLANIFGRATLEKKPKVEKEVVKEEASEESNDTTEAENATDNKGKSFGVETLQGGSMTDYFKKKMSQFKLNFASKAKNEENDDDYESRPSFGFGFAATESPEAERVSFGFGFVAATEKSENLEETEAEITRKEKKRKRKASADDDDAQASKKKPRTEVQSGLANEGFEIPEDNCDSGVSLDENPFEVKLKVKKCKKSKNKAEGVINPVFNDIDDDNQAENEADVKAVKKEKKKKKKKHCEDKIEEEGVANPTFNETSLLDDSQNMETPVNPFEVVVKDKKKKKKKKHEDSGDLGLENPIFDENSMQDEPSSSLRKKKKKQKQAEESFTMEEIEEPAVEAEKQTKKKKKKVPSETTEISLDVCPEEVIKKKKKSKVSIHDSAVTCTSSRRSSSEGLGSPHPDPADVNQKQELDVDVELGIGVTVSSISNNFGITDDLILNISSTDPKPILHTPQNAHARVKRRKSVRIDESLNQERIIPNILQQKQMELQDDAFDVHVTHGVANEGFDLHAKDPGFYEHNCELDLDATATKPKSKKRQNGVVNPAFRDVQSEVTRCMESLDKLQAEVENDINENRNQQRHDDDFEIMETKYIGTVSKLSENRIDPISGHVQLAFKNAQLSQTLNPYDMQTQDVAKRGYRHLVKGDVELEFTGTNLQLVTGYATSESLNLSKKRMAKAVLQEGSSNRMAAPRGHVTDMEMVKKLQGKKARHNQLVKTSKQHRSSL